MRVEGHHRGRIDFMVRATSDICCRKSCHAPAVIEMTTRRSNPTVRRLGRISSRRVPRSDAIGLSLKSMRAKAHEGFILALNGTCPPIPHTDFQHMP